jgi:hypothetical protein
LNQHIFA